MNVPASAHEPAVARGLRFTALVATVLLLALIARWVLVAPSIARIVVGSILALPFALAAPFLYARHRRTYAWLTLALAPPLVLGLTEAVANPATRVWSSLFVCIVLAAFVVLVAYLRATRSASPL
ncbi:MAG TPA: DUF2069 domain-containing protein [Steroidobacteraceae bacterium]